MPLPDPRSFAPVRLSDVYGGAAQTAGQMMNLDKMQAERQFIEQEYGGLGNYMKQQQAMAQQEQALKLFDAVPDENMELKVQAWNNSILRQTVGPMTYNEAGPDIIEVGGLRFYKKKGEWQQVKEPAEALSPLGKLVREHNALPEGDSTKAMYLQAIKKNITQTGQRITLGPDGTVTIEEGPLGAGGAMTKKTQGTIEEKLMGANEQLARLEQISGEFRPEYLEVGTRLKNMWTGLKAKLGQGVSPEDRQELQSLQSFKRKAIENINLYIKEITGAQMSEREATRLRQAMPDVGDNWYSGDDPITFKSKLDDIIRNARLAAARYNWYRTKGLAAPEINKLIKSDSAISLKEVAARMRERAAELQKEEMAPDQIKAVLKEEFGL